MESELIWTIVFGVGLLVFLLGIFPKKSPVKINPVLGAFLGICLMLPGFVWGVYVYMDEPAAPIQYVPTTATVVAPGFTITGSASTPAGIDVDDDDGVITIPFTIYPDGTAKEADNTTWVQPAITFSINPIAPAGATADDLATIYFKFNNVDLSFYTDDTYYVFTKTGTRRNVIWQEGGQTMYGEGSATMLLTATATVYLNCTVGATSLGEWETSYQGPTTSITFSNTDGTWSKTYAVQFVYAPLT